jgi:hypothetical protein
VVRAIWLFPSKLALGELRKLQVMFKLQVEILISDWELDRSCSMEATKLPRGVLSQIDWITLKKAVVQPRVCDLPWALHLSLRSIMWEYHMMCDPLMLSVHFLHALHNKQQFTFSACYHLVWPMWNQLLPGRSMQVHGVAKLVIALKVDSCNLQLFYSWSYDAKLLFQYVILA